MPAPPTKYLVYVTLNGVMREWYQFHTLNEAEEQYRTEVRYFANGMYYGCEINLYAKPDDSGSIPQTLRQWKWDSNAGGPAHTIN